MAKLPPIRALHTEMERRLYNKSSLAYPSAGNIKKKKNGCKWVVREKSYFIYL